MFAVVLAAVFLVFDGPIQSIFTHDPGMADALTVPWRWLVAMIVVGGAVFALDGVLLGASDAVFLRNLSIGAMLGGFLPLTLLSMWLGWGLAGVWAGYFVSVVLRLVGVLWRFRSMKWARTGVEE